jgi:hypothetical protein
MQGKTMLMPAIWGGLAIGILSALPFVGAINICCCAWVITGGLLAAYVLQSNTPEPITAGDGAVVGLLAGIAGAFVYGIVLLPVNIISGPVQRRALLRLVDQLPNLPPELRETITNIGSSPSMAIVGAVTGVLMMLFVGGIFATAGGLLGSVLFKKTAVPQPVAPDQPHDIV